jgi:hypothetical protein
MGRGVTSLARRGLPRSAPPSPPAAGGPGGPRRVGVSGPRRPARRVGQPRVEADGPSPHVHTLPGAPHLGVTDRGYTGARPIAGRSIRPPGRLRLAPEAGGTRFRVVRFPPASELPTDEAGEPARF